MGRSLHNKIYLGRRTLLNDGRTQCVASFAIAVAWSYVVLTVIKDLF
jgi:hypothetical protein